MVNISEDVIRDWQVSTAAGSGGYTVLTRASVRRMTGQAVAGYVPVTSLSWDWDGTSTSPLSGRVTVPAIDWSDPADPIDWRPSNLTSALSPFGNVMRVDMAVDNGIDPPVWLTLGQGLIVETTYNRPAETIDVTIGDLSLVFLQAVTVADWSVTAPTPVADLLRVALGGAWVTPPNIVDPTGVLAKTFSAVVTWPPGTPLWEIVQQVVQTVDPTLRACFDRDASLLIDRKEVDTAVPPPPGTRPTFSLSTGSGGHITEMSSTLTRDGAVNIVAIAVEDTEVVDPTYVTISGTESDMAEKVRKDVEDVAGTGTGFAKKVTSPSGRRGGFTNRQPTPPRWPFSSTSGHGIGAVFGQQGAIWSNNTHYGTDFSATTGNQVVSVCQGRIVGVYPNGGPEGWAGKYVVQQASDGSRFYYCHLSGVDVRVGDFLLREEPIGKAGATGNTTGPHLHLERRDPPYAWASNSVDWRRAGDVK